MLDLPKRSLAGRPAGALLATLGSVLATAALLVPAGAANAAVHLSSESAYTGRSTACPHPKPAGTTCVFRFRASSNGYALRFHGKTAISSWECRNGGGEALLGGKVAGSYRVPLLILQSDGKLLGTVGHGARRVSVTGHIAEAGSKVVLRFHLARGHCVTPKVTLIEGLVPGTGH